MTLPLAAILTVVAAVASGIFGVILSKRLGLAWGLIDRPGARKVHQRAVPRTGGIGFSVAAVLVAGVAIALVGREAFPTDNTHVAWASLGLAALFMLAVGVVDDAVSLPGYFKLLALIVAALALIASGSAFGAFYLNPEHEAVLNVSRAGGWPLTVLWVCGITVAIAFIDGLDGLAGGIALIATAAIGIVAGMAGQWDVFLATLALGGALIGFLCFNGPWGRPARIFMGDGGTMFLGFVLAGLPLMLNSREGVGTMRAMVLPAVVLGVPIIDAGLTIIRRKVLQRRSLFAAEDGHVHHRLLIMGLSGQHAVLILWGVTILAAMIGFFATLADGWMTFGLLALALPIWIGLFRAAGSVRGRETVTAIRRHRRSTAMSKKYQAAFEEAQLRLKKAGDFSDWWRETCAAADALDFLSLDLNTLRRTGTPYHLEWKRPPRDGESIDSPELPGLAGVNEAIDVTLEVPQRRIGKESAPIKLACRVLVTRHGAAAVPDDKAPDDATDKPATGGVPPVRAATDLESTMRRVTLFSRLLSETGLANMDDPDRIRHAKAHRRRLANDVPSEAGDVERFPERAADRPAGEPRVAIVHDFLYVNGGAEKVLEQMLEVFPHADLFSLIDFVAPADRGFLRHKPVTTSFIQKLPLARYKHRAYLPLMPIAIEQLDLKGYDVVLSSSYCVAKGVITGPDQVHVSYCHSPVRYAWDLQGQYLAEAGIRHSWWPHKFLKNVTTRLILHYLRTWDARSSTGVDAFLANSDFVGRRILKTYRRESETIYPPVDTDGFEAFSEKQGYYFTSSRMVPYKKMAMIAEAFTRTPERRLVMGGEGPEFEKIRKIAGPNVQLIGHTDFKHFVHYMQRARAFVFAAEEDFGIIPVEAMACGTPVITYGRGGATETVLDGVTGVHFEEQTPDSLIAAVERFERIDEEGGGFDPRAIRRRAERFGAERFRSELRESVMRHWHRRRQERSGKGEVVEHEEGDKSDKGDKSVSAYAEPGGGPSRGNGRPSNGRGLGHDDL